MGVKVDVLLVEDNKEDLELILRALKKVSSDVNIHLAENGEEALDFVYCRGAFEGNRSIRPKVIIMDLKLPKINGLEVLKLIKSDNATKTIPVVMLTSSREEKDLVESYALGVNSYIVKPVDFDEFGEAVKALGIYWLDLNRNP